LLQLVNGESHTTPQLPSAQLGAPFSGMLHRLPHPPQLSTSALVSRQTSPQGMKPSWQVKRHTPFTHTASAFGGGRQVASQPPQWSSRSASTTHSLPHVVSPSRQTMGGVTDPVTTQRLVTVSQV
jgi:hypothetical protein